MSPFRVQPYDLDRYLDLRARMRRQDPVAFAGTSEDDGHVLLAQDRAAVFAVEGEPGTLVALAGVARGPAAGFSHRARLWGVFVEPGWRGRGFGRAVVTAAIAHARSWGVEHLDLVVGEASTEARGLYERLGFVEWGRKAEAVEHEGRRYDWIYLSLRLQPSPGPLRGLEDGPQGGP